MDAIVECRSRVGVVRSCVLALVVEILCLGLGAGNKLADAIMIMKVATYHWLDR